MWLDLSKTVRPWPARQGISSRSLHPSEGQMELQKLSPVNSGEWGQSLLCSLKQFEGKPAEFYSIVHTAFPSFSSLLSLILSQL